MDIGGKEGRRGRQGTRAGEEQTGDDGGDLDKERQAEVAGCQTWIYFKGGADKIC